jgi:3-hydroxyisobutyrate dehydrogenase
MASQKIGFVGLGNMGAPMSANIAKAGYDVVVYDVDAARTKAHAATIGATPAATLAELGAAVDIVVTMLPTGKIVTEAAIGEGGFATTLKPGSLLIDMSSSVPGGSRDLADALAKKGILFVDAPVSGAVPRATTGTLTLMVGANSDADYALAEPVLKTMGNMLFRTGSVGTGHAMKALNNYVAAAGFAAASEALIMGRMLGLDPAVALEIMNVSTGRNFSTEKTIKSEVIEGRYASGFGLALLTKDVRIAADLSTSLNADLPLVAQTIAWWEKAQDAIGGAKDHTEAFKVWEEAASGR